MQFFAFKYSINGFRTTIDEAFKIAPISSTTWSPTLTKYGYHVHLKCFLYPDEWIV